MIPSRFLLVLALVFAAAVIVPLRRAQRAFPSRSDVAAVVSAPRPSLRRRPSAARVITRRIQESQSQSIVSASVDGKSKQERVSPAVKRARRVVAAEHDQMLDCVDVRVHPEQAYALGPCPAPCVTTQVVADIPKPPPRRAAGLA